MARQLRHPGRGAVECVRCVCVWCACGDNVECDFLQACQLSDCGECSSCRHMIKFGGTGRSKQACVHRRYGIASYVCCHSSHITLILHGVALLIFNFGISAQVHQVHKLMHTTPSRCPNMAVQVADECEEYDAEYSDLKDLLVSCMLDHVCALLSAV